MGQRAVIGKNNDLLPFDETVDKLRTPGIGGSDITWIPEEKTRCESLSVSVNGTYAAADAGKYGYNYVVVNVPGNSVTGTDGDGDEATATVDPDTGEIEITKIPSSIRVTTLPSKTIYVDGETIVYTGIVVHAYTANGQDMGAVPFNELVFPVNEADVVGNPWTDGGGLNSMMLYYTAHYAVDWRGNEYVVYVHTPAVGHDDDYPDQPATFGGSGPATLLVTRYNGYNYAMLVTGDGPCRVDMFTYAPDTDGDGKNYGWTLTGGTSARAYKGRFSSASWEEYLTEIPESTVNPTGIDPSNLHATQTLPVQWSRTGDGAVLETSFDISVTTGSA